MSNLEICVKNKTFLQARLTREHSEVFNELGVDPNTKMTRIHDLFCKLNGFPGKIPFSSSCEYLYLWLACDHPVECGRGRPLNDQVEHVYFLWIGVSQVSYNLSKFSKISHGSSKFHTFAFRIYTRGKFVTFLSFFAPRGDNTGVEILTPDILPPERRKDNWFYTIVTYFRKRF